MWLEETRWPPRGALPPPDDRPMSTRHLSRAAPSCCTLLQQYWRQLSCHRRSSMSLLRWGHVETSCLIINFLEFALGSLLFASVTKSTICQQATAMTWQQFCQQPFRTWPLCQRLTEYKLWEQVDLFGNADLASVISSRFPCCGLLALSWNTTNENPSTDTLSRAINYSLSDLNEHLVRNQALQDHTPTVNTSLL